MKKIIQVLLVDDDEEDYILVRDLLKNIVRQKYKTQWVSSYNEAVEKLATESFDIILVDFILGKNTGIDLIKQIRETTIQTPIILLTGLGSEQVDIEAMNAGASDYIVKGEIDSNTLERSIRYSINQAQIQLELLKNEKGLRNAEKFAVTGRVAQIIAHEVRNPLTNIRLGLAQLQEEIQAPTEIIKTLGNLIERNCDRINMLITSLLDSTRFLELHIEHTSVNQILDETIQLAGDRIKFKQAEIVKEYSTEDCSVYVDKNKVKIALLNIIVNATEAVAQGKGILTFKTERENDKCIISIHDNGVGIEPEDLNKIFEPYYTNKENGKGLGLISAQNIIMNHKGDIKVESEPRKGTTFIVSLNFSPSDKTKSNSEIL